MRLVLGLLVALASAAAHGQYPAKPVRLIIPFPPGGSNDVVGRVVAAQLGERLGQGVIVEVSQHIAAETAKWTRVVQQANIKAQ